MGGMRHEPSLARHVHGSMRGGGAAHLLGGGGGRERRRDAPRAAAVTRRAAIASTSNSRTWRTVLLLERAVAGHGVHGAAPAHAPQHDGAGPGRGGGVVGGLQRDDHQELVPGDAAPPRRRPPTRPGGSTWSTWGWSPTPPARPGRGRQPAELQPHGRRRSCRRRPATTPKGEVGERHARPSPCAPWPFRGCSPWSPRRGVVRAGPGAGAREPEHVAAPPAARRRRGEPRGRRPALRDCRSPSSGASPPRQPAAGGLLIACSRAAPGPTSGR